MLNLKIPHTSPVIIKCARYISQFRIPLNDCRNPMPERKVIDPKACAKRDRGLVLGVYYNESVAGERAILTAAAAKYNKDNGGKLWKLLELSPIPKLGEARVFFDVDPKYAFVAVAGLGTECYTYNTVERLDEHKEAIRTAAGVGARALQELLPAHIDVESFGNAEAAAEGAELAVWQFTEYRTRVLGTQGKVKLHLYDDCDFEGWEIGRIKADSQNLARYLEELPANVLNPTSFAKIIVDLLCELDINVHVKTRGWASAHEMGGFVALSHSSVQPPLYVEIGYFGGNPCKQPVVFIGKGVTFDSGGLQLRSREHLRYMRGDMAGAACVVAIVRAAALLKLPINIRGILPLCEMMPNCMSPKFGDVISNAHEKSVKIRMPAREGRLLIADSLAYARNYWPEFIVDVGTMSEELEHALGNAACACYSNSEGLFRDFEVAGSRTGDRIWRMPLWNFYSDRISDVQETDLANTARHFFGDSPNCAAFLRQFVCDGKWVHLDTYNVTYTKGRDFKYLRRGMTGRPTRTIIDLLQLRLCASGEL
ncbi:cytosol aminopeptidase-like [Cydia splendana]|uniref:cytosol aminopeptidase-like n=1 Tax=Cydia splendana TaxID=1100963 RepID=UPI00300CB80B